MASAVLNGKFYAIGGMNLLGVEIYDPSTESWASGISLPSEVNLSNAINGKIYLVGGRNASNELLNQVLCFDPTTNQWFMKAHKSRKRS